MTKDEKREMLTAEVTIHFEEGKRRNATIPAGTYAEALHKRYQAMTIDELADLLLAQAEAIGVRLAHAH